jgi:hypothetical protein
VPDLPAEDINGDLTVDVYDCRGPQGSAGANGVNGTHCWDLNGNGVPDMPAEDINGDLTVDVYDCRGPQGVAGISGLNGTHCWDLNGNGVGDVGTEDTNGDGVVDVLDCRAETLVVTNATESTNTASTTSLVFEDMPDMTLDINTTQESLFVITFSGEVWLDANNYLMGRAYVDATLAEPGSNGNLWFTKSASVEASTVSVTFFVPNVPPGSHTVKIQWRVWSPGFEGFSDDRSLVVMAFPY